MFPPFSFSSRRLLIALIFSLFVMFRTAEQKKRTRLPAQKPANVESSECFLTFGDEAGTKGQIEAKSVLSSLCLEMFFSFKCLKCIL